MTFIHKTLGGYKFLIKFYQKETIKAKTWLDTNGKYYDPYSETYIEMYTTYKNNLKTVKKLEYFITQVTD